MGLNMATDVETYTPGELVTNLVEEVAIAGIFDGIGNLLGGNSTRKIWQSLYEDIRKKTVQYSFTYFIKELYVNVKDGMFETFFGVFWEWLKEIFSGGKAVKSYA